MIKTKKISSTILFSILSIFLVIGSIFTFNTIKKKDSVVFADSVTTNFNGSNVYFPVSQKFNVPSSSESNLTWFPNHFYGFNLFDGNNVWNIGDIYYYSADSNQCFLNISSNTWSSMSWSGLTSFSGSNIWNIGDTYYYSSGSNQYVLNTSTNTWSSMSWSGLTSFSGNNIWNIGDTYYYSRYNGSSLTQFVLNTGSYPIVSTAYNTFISSSFNFVDNGNNSFTLSHNTLVFVDYSFLNCAITDKFLIVPINVNIDDYLSNVTINDFVDSITFSPLTNYTFSYFIPYSYNNTFYFIPFSFNGYNLTNLNFTKVQFMGEREIPISWYVCSNTLIYTNSLNEDFSITFLMKTFSSNADYFVEYFGDTFPLRELVNDSVHTWLDEYSYVFKNRIYYLNSDYLNSQQYQRGYSVGYNNGQNAGYSAGYSAGVEAVSQTQYNSGYSAGYNEGVSSANNYSFLGLISAVIDAPIKAFTGLFNFNLLGVNIMNFITALFTLAVIITIVKKVV